MAKKKRQDARRVHNMEKGSRIYSTKIQHENNHFSTLIQRLINVEK